MWFPPFDEEETVMTPSPSAGEPLPCPWCGSNAIECEELDYNGLGHHSCGNCGAAGPIAEKTVAASLAAWNRRAAPPATASEQDVERGARLMADFIDMEARKDEAYLERNRVVAALASLFPSGTARTDIPGWSPDWHGCVYIDLPTGQCSWHYHDSHAHLFAHLPPYKGQWDGHTTEEKYARVTAIAALPASGERERLIEAMRSAGHHIEHGREHQARKVLYEALAASSAGKPLKDNGER